MMTYKEWHLIAIKEPKGIAVDYTDPEGKSYSASFCFNTLEEALDYSKLCIDQSIREKTLHSKEAEKV